MKKFEFGFLSNKKTPKVKNHQRAYINYWFNFIGIKHNINLVAQSL